MLFPQALAASSCGLVRASAGDRSHREIFPRALERRRRRRPRAPGLPPAPLGAWRDATRRRLRLFKHQLILSFPDTRSLAACACGARRARKARLDGGVAIALSRYPIVRGGGARSAPARQPDGPRPMKTPFDGGGSPGLAGWCDESRLASPQPRTSIPISRRSPCFAGFAAEVPRKPINCHFNKASGRAVELKPAKWQTGRGRRVSACTACSTAHWRRGRNKGVMA